MRRRRGALGLTLTVVAARAVEYGQNRNPQPAGPSVLRRVLRQLAGPLIYILFIAAALAARLGHSGDAAVILGVLLVIALIGALQQGRAASSMDALLVFARLRARVLCDGREQSVAAQELVPGDILLLAQAMRSGPTRA